MNEAPLIGLAHNAALLLALVLAFDLALGRWRGPQQWLIRAGLGALLGGIGMLLMLNPWQFAPGIFFDTRSILLSLTGLFFGTLPTLVAMALMAALRITQGGAFLTGVATILASGLIGLAWRRLRRRAGRPSRHYGLGELYLFGMLVELAVLGLMFTLPAGAAWRVLEAIALPSLLVFPVATALLGALMVSRLERLRAHAELRLGEERLRLALAAARQGLFDCNLRSGEVVVNEEYARMLGYVPDGFRETVADLLERMHPEDRPAVEAVVREYLAGARQDHRLEFRLRGRHGNWVHVLSVGRLASVEAGGRPLRLIGTHTDLTAQRSDEDRLRVLNAEAARLLAESDQSRLALLSAMEDQRDAQARLAQSEARFRLVIENSNAGMYVLREGRLVYANPRLEEMVGAPAGSLAGAEFTGLLSTEDAPQVAAAHALLAPGKTAASHAVRALRPDGTVVVLDLSEVATEFEGAPAIVGMAQDVGERLRAQAEIQGYVARLERTTETTLNAVSLMVEQRDPYTAGHERRVGQLAAAIGAEMGLEARRVEGLRLTGLVHDVGKIAVPAEILSKPSRLSQIEFEMVKGHSQSGYEVLKGIDSPWPLAEVVLQHHERLDGSGYPRGLKGEQILPEARILAVADTVEAMTSHRPYRPGVALEVALAEIEKHSGRLYDPQAVAACLRLFREKGYAFAS